MRELCERYVIRGVALTDHGTEADIEWPRTADLLAHLTKPVDVKKLSPVSAGFGQAME